MPNITTIIPSFNIGMAVNGAMALYWDRLFYPNYRGWPAILAKLAAQDPPVAAPAYPPDLDLGDTVLTERRKILCALRALVNILPMIQNLLGRQLMEAKGGPAEAKFDSQFRYLKLMSDVWALELKQLEEMEGIVFGLLPPIPGIRLTLDAEPMIPTSMQYVMSLGAVYIEEGRHD